MRYAEVAVNSPAARSQTFSYSVPDNLRVGVGWGVLVPFGARTLQGIVTGMPPVPGVENTRDVLAAIGSGPLLTEARVELARWLSDHYLSSPFEALALMLPPGFERQTITFVEPQQTPEDTSLLGPEERSALDRLTPGGIELKEIEKLLGKRKAQLAVAGLVKRGLASRRYELAGSRVKAKKVAFLSLAVPPEEALRLSQELRQKRAGKQAALIDFLNGFEGRAAPAAAAMKAAGCPPASVKALAGAGVIKTETREVRRKPQALGAAEPSTSLTLTSPQQAALDAIRPGLVSKPKVFLLHGVTGSGKTEVYLRALAEAVKLGKKGIVLVPEISLTPQTIARFAARFPGRVAVLHSRLSLGEQYDEWRRIRAGECDVVVGARSALFAPQPDLGLIIIDEEHEWTYKQQENSPRYHARDAAVRLAELTGASLVLGSATPSLESYHRARGGDWTLLRLPERVVPHEGCALPRVTVVDMRRELRTGNRSIFSRALKQQVSRAVDAREQVILFLNRRGTSSFIQCRGCGFVMRCKRCEIALTYHAARNALVCHHCSFKAPVPARCPECSGVKIKFLGLGTEKLEQEAGELFPQARTLRWDRDTTAQKDAHETILRRFRDHEADILIGTQMVAKGLDLPRVTLVGVISADTSLNLPDFRAGERAFQLLSQVAGRAGRGERGGQVIIQTYSPDHYAVESAAAHDYAAFYDRESEFRRRLGYPPFTDLALLVYTHPSAERCRQEAARMKDLLLEETARRGLTVGVSGPVPAFYSRLRGRARWQILLRGADLSSFLKPVWFPPGWTVDVDPVSLV